MTAVSFIKFLFGEKLAGLPSTAWAGLGGREGNMKLCSTEAGVMFLLRVCSGHVANNDEKVKTLQGIFSKGRIILSIYLDFPAESV